LACSRLAKVAYYTDNLPRTVQLWFKQTLIKNVQNTTNVSSNKSQHTSIDHYCIPTCQAFLFASEKFHVFITMGNGIAAILSAVDAAILSAVAE